MQLQGKILRIEQVDNVRSNVVLLNDKGIEDTFQTRDLGLVQIASSLLEKQVTITFGDGPAEIKEVV